VFDRVAPRYDLMNDLMSLGLHRLWKFFTIQVSGVRAGDRVLDVAGGTADLSLAFAKKVGPRGQVWLTDINHAMLSRGRDRVLDQGFDLPVAQCNAEKLPFPDDWFDCVTVAFGLRNMTHKDAALAEMRRVLRPGGRLALNVFQPIDRHPFYVALDQAIRVRLGASGVGEIFALGDADALRSAIAAAGFRDIAVEPSSMDARFPDPDGFMAGEIEVDTAAIPSMQALDSAARRDLVDSLRLEMAAPLAAVTRDGAVVMPFHVLIATARN
jgi:ubiquinone/menaquinone biosynthesis methyltransferase